MSVPRPTRIVSISQTIVISIKAKVLVRYVADAQIGIPVSARKHWKPVAPAWAASLTALINAVTRGFISAASHLGMPS
jgi:hypothetical protein